MTNEAFRMRGVGYLEHALDNVRVCVLLEGTGQLSFEGGDVCVQLADDVYEVRTTTR